MMIALLIAYVAVGLAWCGYMNYRVARYMNYRAARYTLSSITQAHDRHHALLWPVSVAGFLGHGLGSRFRR